MRVLSGTSKAYLQVLRAKRYFLSNPAGVSENDLAQLSILAKKAEKLVKVIPRSPKRDKERKRPINKRKRIRKVIRKSFYYEPRCQQDLEAD